ncbi:peroxiredoxin [soil metagenome]|jgi:peroxiredoxin Q/BCP|nr:peroxiredoxin [Acidobacteriota bacterium]
MKTGENAPDFTLKDDSGNNWKLSDQRGKMVVLLFYPGDNTPVCTNQLCSVRDNWEDYAKTGAEVIGISTDSAESHKGFAEKHDLPLMLLSDEKSEVIEKYDVKSWLPGRSARAVVVIDKDGIIRHHQVQSLSLFRPKDVEVLAAIRQAEKF